MDNVVKLLVLPGDGIGPEITSSALKVLDALKNKLKVKLEIDHGLIGGAAFDEYGEHFPKDTRKKCLSADVILFGAVGGPVSQQLEPKWKGCEVNSILQLRKLLDLYANIRPVKIDKALAHNSPLRLERFGDNLPDLVVVRELSGDIYFGEKGRSDDGLTSFDQATYTVAQIERITKFAFEMALKRTKKIHSIDKANVLETSRMWREVVSRISKDYSEVSFESMLVDNCAMQLITSPTSFDVILTSNMFGDILSDAAAVIPGSLGLLASASYGSTGKWLYEPPSGSAPDIAGKNIANPIGMIRCVGLMLNLSLGEKELSEKVEDAISKTIEKNILTKDISGIKTCSTTVELTDSIVAILNSSL